MRSLLAVAWLLLTLLAPLTAHGKEVFSSRLMEREYQSMLLLQSKFIPSKCVPQGFIGGSAVLLSPNFALTARHVVVCDKETPYEIRVRMRAGAPVTAKVVRSWDDLDTVLLKLDAPLPAVGLRLRKRPVRNGEHLCAVSGQHWARKCGDVSLASDERALVSFRSVPGNSGAPVYDRSGRLAGLVSGRMKDDDADFMTLIVLIPKDLVTR